MSAIPESWLRPIHLAQVGLDDAAIAGLLPALREQVLREGEVLFRQGDEGDGLFFVAEGRVTISLVQDGSDAGARDDRGAPSERAIVVDDVGPGGIVGEGALLVGGRRSATVTAAEETRVLGLNRERFDALVRDHPAVVDVLSRALQARMRRSKVAGHLRALFGDLDKKTLQELEASVTWVQLGGGQTLFHKGDPADGAYIVVLGRLRVVVLGPGGQERIIDEIGPRQWVGEMALLTHKERSATVYALRDTELVWLPQSAFDDIVCRHPRALLETSRLLVERLQRQMSSGRHRLRGARSFAIVPVGPAVSVERFASELARCFARHGSVLHLSAARVDAELGKAGIARSNPGEAAHLRLTSWLMAQEEAHDFVVYEADAAWSEWTDRALRHADDTLFVAHGRGSPELGEVELRLAARAKREKTGRMPRQRLVLLQPDEETTFPGTAAWLAGRRVDEHHHVRKSSRADVERLVRILTGNAVGVVFGGGGSRGYAHIGVVRALYELDVPVDAVGGSSSGAMVAVMRAMQLGADDMLRILPPRLRAAFMDPTLPLVAFMKGKNVLEGARAIAGDHAVEDLLIPTFIVSTNLTRGKEHVHRRGSVALAIRASSSIPGIFPPVPWEGDLLVDGGLSNNVPVDVMAAAFGGKTIAVDVIPEVDMLAEGDLPPALSGFHAAWRKVNPFAERVGMPNILSVLMRSATSSSRGLRRAEDMPEGSLLLRPQVSRWNMIDFTAAEPIADEGYRGTVEAIRRWWSQDGRGAGADVARAAAARKT